MYAVIIISLAFQALYPVKFQVIGPMPPQACTKTIAQIDAQPLAPAFQRAVRCQGKQDVYLTTLAFQCAEADVRKPGGGLQLMNYICEGFPQEKPL